MFLEQDYMELLELQQIIRDGVEEAVPGPVRVRAEVASVQQRTNGHCYLELCQSDEKTQLAKVRAIIWRSRADVLLKEFARANGAPLQPGMALIFEVRVSYSEIYGVSLIVEDIDFGTTLGEAELRRRRTIEKLEKEGLMELQKELALPPIPYSLAVISAPDAAGYGDFRRHLLENEYGFAFDVTLYPATMQGESAPASIVAALESAATPDANFSTNGFMERSDAGGFGGYAPRPLGVQGDNSKFPAPEVLERSDAGGFGGYAPRPLGVQGDNSLPRRGGRQEAGGFDAVLILRGGGSVLDLACFDDYELCAAIARCPVPVCTAIGHDRDEHAADLVAAVAVKTPTALADLFIDAVAAEDEMISSYVSRLKLAFAAKLSAQIAAVDRLETRITAANPRLLLKRGYTLITNDKGILLKNASAVSAGDGIRVLFPDGTLKCTVNGKV